jgi:membrane protease YdiL (CAAX protease family)
LPRSNFGAKLRINHFLLLIQLHGTIPRLLVLIGFCLVCGGIFAMGGLALAGPLFGVSLTDMSQLMGNLESVDSIRILKFLQLLNTLGLFIIPAILFALLFIKNPIQQLKLDKSLKLTNVIWVILLFATLLPAINWLVEWNSSMDLPQALNGLEEWMKASESRAMEMTKAFLQMEGQADLFINIFLIALLPAVGEELIFRGIVQQTINKNSGSYHWGIWISAILFSALHMQFNGFLPRMLLGAFFGYLFVWSGNLWLPILAHFINNATAVIVSYILGVEAMEKQFDQIGTSDGTIIYSILGLLLFGFLFYRFYLDQQKSRLP